MITRHEGFMTTDSQVRCRNCQRLLAEKATRPWRITCSRCGSTNTADPRGASHASSAVEAIKSPPSPEAPSRPVPQPTKPVAPKPKKKRRLSMPQPSA